MSYIYLQEQGDANREQIDFYLSQTGSPNPEAKDCPNCDGIGELPGDPNTKQFATCAACDGSGVKGGEE